MPPPSQTAEQEDQAEEEYIGIEEEEEQLSNLVTQHTSENEVVYIDLPYHNEVLHIAVNTPQLLDVPHRLFPRILGVLKAKLQRRALKLLEECEGDPNELSRRQLEFTRFRSRVLKQVFSLIQSTQPEQQELQKTNGFEYSFQQNNHSVFDDYTSARRREVPASEEEWSTEFEGVFDKQRKRMNDAFFASLGKRPKVEAEAEDEGEGCGVYLHLKELVATEDPSVHVYGRDWSVMREGGEELAQLMEEVVRSGVSDGSGVSGVNGMNGMSGVGGMSGVNGVSGGVKEETNGGDVKWMGQEQLELVPNENKEEVNGGVKEEMNEGVEEETTGSVREEGMESEQNETVQTRKQDDDGMNPDTDQRIEESTTQEQNTPPTLPLLTPQETAFVQFIWDHLHLAVCDWTLAVEKATQPRSLDEELSGLVDADDAWEMQEAAKESVPGYDSAALNVKPCFLPVSSSTVCARDGHFLVSSLLLVFCSCFTRTIDYSHGRLIRCSHCRRYQHYSCTLFPHSSSSIVAAAKTASSTPSRTRATIAARRPSTCPNAFAPKARWC